MASDDSPDVPRDGAFASADPPRAGAAPDPFAGDPPLARAVRKVDRVLGLAEQLALIGLGLFIVFVAIAWLVTEHVGSGPLEHASADVRYTVFLMAMIGGAYAAHHRRLLSLDVINRMVSGRARAYLRLVTTLFAIVVTAVFFWYALDLFLDTRKEKAIEHWMPASAAKAAMMIGAGLILLHLVAQVVIDVAYLAAGKTPPEPEMGAA